MRHARLTFALWFVSLGGCALDLERLRGDARDAGVLDASGVDAPGVDAPGLDASGVDAGVDAAAEPDAFVSRGGALRVLARGPAVDASSRLAAAREARGAYYVLVGPSMTEGHALTRTACDAEISTESLLSTPTGDVVSLADADEDGVLDVVAADVSQLYVAFGEASSLAFASPSGLSHGLNLPVAVGAPAFGEAHPDLIVANTMGSMIGVRQSTPRAFSGTRPVPVDAGSSLRDFLVADVEDGGDAEVVMLVSSSGSPKLVIVHDDGGALASSTTRRSLHASAAGLARTGAPRSILAFGGNALEWVDLPKGGWGPFEVVGASFIDAAVGDLEGDGIAEVAALDRNTGSIRVFHGIGALEMIDEVPLGTAALSGGEIEVLDVDGDGRDELLVHAASEVILVGRVAASCP
jgi:hypothetical protein